MKPTVTLFLLAFLSVSATAQQPPDSAVPEKFGLNHLSSYLGLMPDDISFRADYTEPDSFRLKLVADLMIHPMGMVDYCTSLRNAYSPGQPEIAASILFQDLAGENQSTRTRGYIGSAQEVQRTYNLYYSDPAFNQMLAIVATYLDVSFPRSTEMMLNRLDKSQRRFLRVQFKEIIVTHEEEEFMSIETIDSVEKAEEEYAEQFVAFGTRIDKDPIIDVGIQCLKDLMLELRNLRSQLSSGKTSIDIIMGETTYLPKGADLSTFLGKQPGWAIGGKGNDYYSGDYNFIFDFGGDDVYDLSYDHTHPHGVVIIDLSGDDRYHGTTDFTLGSGAFSVGLLLDFGGNDRYDAKSFSIGSGYFGFGLLYDAAGDDRYDGDIHVQAAASFGLGLLIDEGGRDIYNAALHSQGFGFVEGLGVIFELDGADSYYAGGKYKDILRYDVHYLSLSQGFGYGLRPWMSGGVGAIIDTKGNDSYNADIFGQGASYWWSLGAIYDSSGNDNYQCFQYGQGAATHMSLGVLIDDYGNDVYFGKGLMQGCGHDYSCGLILDRHGDDTYTAYDLSQAAGSANGAGLLIDCEGDDRYFIRNPKNTQGYGNPRRDFGSIGLFIDLAGSDQYWGNGHDNSYWRTDSKWGGGMDIEMRLPDSSAEAK